MTKDNIKETYANLKKQTSDLSELKIATEAFECLVNEKCRDQYTRFGNTLRVDLDTTEYELDWKMAFSVFFYVLFAFTHSAMASVEQKPGLRFGMGIGIMFCMNEINMLSSAAA